MTNPWSAAVASRLGADEAWLSPELTGGQISAVAAGSPVTVGVVAYGRTELMVAENCALAAIGPCARRCSSCARRARTWELVDRKGYRFPVRTDDRGRTHVYNSVTLDLSRALPEIVRAGVGTVVLDVRGIPANEAQRVVAAFHSRMSAAIAGRAANAEQLIVPATTGHFFRGVR